MKFFDVRRSVLVLLVSLMFIPFAFSDEGMWEYSNIPKEKIAKKYGFRPSSEWLNHLMRSSVRFNSGGSGSFVSSTGLILTNHHVGTDVLQKISNDQHNYFNEGFLAKDLKDERIAPKIEIDSLEEIVDVTKNVTGVVTPDMTPTQAVLAKREVIANLIEANSSEGHPAELVTLYKGGQYHLYKYKRYTDVRLVFAPEYDAAAFGGDPDNFEYPRYDLDMCIFRAYETGPDGTSHPAHIDHFLKWSPTGPAKGDLVFVSGHPGGTDRLFTVSALTNYRDLRAPETLAMLQAREKGLLAFNKPSPSTVPNTKERARRAEISHEDLLSVQNSRKAYIGLNHGFVDGTVMAKKQRDETAVRQTVESNPDLKQYAGAWNKITQAEDIYHQLYLQRAFFESGWAFNSELFGLARALVRMTQEDLKPNTSRLPEYRGGEVRKSLVAQIYSPAPIYEDFEIAKLTQSLSYMAERLGAQNTLVQKVLEGKSPEIRAQELINRTKLLNIDERKRIASGGVSAVTAAAATDPLIQLALTIDPDARNLRKNYEEKVSGVEEPAYGQITQALYKLKGNTTYPDATFTLRLSYGVVKGYREKWYKPWGIAPFTTFGEAFKHEADHQAQEPFNLPPSWHQKQKVLNPSVHLNFVSTDDIIGGNSGSPTVNKNGELVGLIFDGNIESLSGDYIYTEKQARAVSVDSGGMLQSLRVIYGAGRIADELGK